MKLAYEHKQENKTIKQREEENANEKRVRKQRRKPSKERNKEDMNARKQDISKQYSYSSANDAWVFLREVIFPIQPLAHWLDHVGEGMVCEKDSQAS